MNLNTKIGSIGLLAPADAARVREVEKIIGFSLPNDFRNFLLQFDGGFLKGRKFIVYSTGSGIHPYETLVHANTNRDADFPLVLAGRDGSEDFGFRKADLPCDHCAVFFLAHETGELTKVAQSFGDFLERVHVLGEKESMTAI